MQSRKFCWWLDEGYSLTLRSSRGRYLPGFHAGFEASNPPRSTQTHPSVPIHFTPVLISGQPPAMVMVIPCGYFSSNRYFGAVFHTAVTGGSSPLPSTSDGPV